MQTAVGPTRAGRQTRVNPFPDARVSGEPASTLAFYERKVQSSEALIEVSMILPTAQAANESSVKDQSAGIVMP
jgi:hypothetical protein